jgi:hypothetical protein
MLGADHAGELAAELESILEQGTALNARMASA